MGMKPSKRFDRFVDLEWVADRGHVRIYRAFHVFRCTPTLLKIVRRRGTSQSCHAESNAQKRLLLEALVLDRIDHPNVVRVIDSGRSRDLELFVALEYTDGQDLGERLDRRGAMSVPQALDIAIAVSRAIESAHERDIVHGDVRPDNIVLLRDGGAKLTGFGHARAPGLEMLQTPPDSAKSLVYLCPHYVATGVLEPGCDIYSLAATLYEAIAGSSFGVPAGRLGTSESNSAPCDSIPPHELPPLHEIAPHVPRALSDEIQRAMSRRPQDRHPSAHAFSLALQSHRRNVELLAPCSGSAAIGDDAPTAPFGVCAALRLLDGLVANGEAIAELRLPAMTAAARVEPEPVQQNAPSEQQPRSGIEPAPTQEPASKPFALPPPLRLAAVSPEQPDDRVAVVAPRAAGPNDRTVYGIAARVRRVGVPPQPAIAALPRIGPIATLRSPAPKRLRYRKVGLAGSGVVLAAGAAMAISFAPPSHSDRSATAVGSSAAVMAAATSGPSGMAGKTSSGYPRPASQPGLAGPGNAPTPAAPLSAAAAASVAGTAGHDAALASDAKTSAQTAHDPKEPKRYPWTAGGIAAGKARELVFSLASNNGWQRCPPA